MEFSRWGIVSAGDSLKLPCGKKARLSTSESGGAKPHSCSSRNPENPESAEYASEPPSRHEHPANDAASRYCQEGGKKERSPPACALLIKQSLVSGRKKKNQSCFFL